MPDTPFWQPLLATLIAASVTTCGIVVIRRFDAWGRRNMTFFTCFAAGVLVSVSFLHIVPESLAMAAQAPAFLLGGYLFMHLVNRFIAGYVCDRNRSPHALGLVPLLGIGLHSFIDGTIYAVTFKVSAFTGVLAALGMMLHEFPEGIITYLLLIRSGVNARTSFALAFVAAALTTPLGMLAAWPFVARIDVALLGNLLGLSAGALVYLGATHLLPAAEQETGRYRLIALASGILVAIGIVFSRHGH